MHTTPFLTSSSPDIFSFSFFLFFSPSFLPLILPFAPSISPVFFFTCFSPSSLYYSFHTYTPPSRCQLHLRTHLPLMIFFFFLSFSFSFSPYFLLFFSFFSLISLIFHFDYLFLLVFCLVSVTASPWPPCFPNTIVVRFFHQHFRS